MVTDKGQLKGKIHYNLAGTVESEADCKGKFGDLQAYMVSEEGNKCVPLLKSARSENTYELRSKTINPEDKDAKDTEGFYIESKNSQFKIKMICAENQKDALIDSTTSTFKVETKDACGDIDVISKIIDSNIYISSAIFIVIGLILLFVAGNRWKMVLGIAGFILGASVVLIFFYVLVNFKYNTVSFVVIGILALVVGGLVAYISSHSAFISYIIIGFPAGFFLSSFLITTFALTMDEVCL